MNSSIEEDLIKEDLIKKLKLIGNVYSSNWETVMKVITTISESKILEKNWENYKQDFEDVYPLDLEKTETWSTLVCLCALVSQRKVLYVMPASMTELLLLEKG